MRPRFDAFAQVWRKEGVKRWQLIRDIILFFAGLSGVAYQLLAADRVEPTLTVVFAAMMGLPAALWGDDVRKKRNGGGGE